MNKRLTDNEFHTKESKERACYIQEPRLQAIYDKLFDLEDIEKELEMPIDKFFQALFGSAKMLKVWCIDPHKGLQKVFLNSFENHETARYFNAFNIDIGSITLGLSQYGKTWALTKEELEK